MRRRRCALRSRNEAATIGGRQRHDQPRFCRQPSAGRTLSCRHGLHVLWSLPLPLAPCVACRGAIVCSCSVIIVVKPYCLLCIPVVLAGCRALALPTVRRVLLLFHACLFPLVVSPLFFCATCPVYLPQYLCAPLSLQTVLRCRRRPTPHASVFSVPSRRFIAVMGPDDTILFYRCNSDCPL